MTPYELRFQIFCQAQSHLLEEYHNKVENDLFVSFPSYEEIETLARKIRTFVESAQPS
jgi:hypothetical protein